MTVMKSNRKDWKNMRLVIAALLLLLAVDASATTYYVANPAPVMRGPKTYEYVSGASNTNNGTDPSTPFATLAHACTTMTTGDTVFIMGGWWSENYSRPDGQDFDRDYNCTLWANVGGTASDPAAFKAFIGSGTGYNITQRPVLSGIRNDVYSGYNDSVWNPGIIIGNPPLKHIVFDSLVIDSCGQAGIVHHHGADSITIKNCWIGRVRRPPMNQLWEDSNVGCILVYTPSAAVQYNVDTTSAWEVYNDTFYYACATGVEFDQPDHPSTADSDNANLLQLYDCAYWDIHDNVFIKGHYGLRLKNNDHNMNVHHNLFIDMAALMVEHGSWSHDSKIHHNLCVGGGGFLSYPGSCCQSFAINNHWFYNNTIVSNGVKSGVWLGYFGTDVDTLVREIKVFNNLFIGQDASRSEDVVINWNVNAEDTQGLWDYNVNDQVGSPWARIYDSSAYYSLTEWRTFTRNSIGVELDANSRQMTVNFLETSDSTSPEYYRLDPDNNNSFLFTGGAGSAGHTLADGSLAPPYIGAIDPYGNWGCTNPDSTVLLSPANASNFDVTVSQEDILVLTWEADNSGQPVTYRVQIADDPSFTNVTHQYNVAVNFLAVGGYDSNHLEDGTGTLHYWRVFVMSGSCMSPPSEYRTFVLQDLAPPEWPIE